jgi:hypothetical protein
VQIYEGLANKSIAAEMTNRHHFMGFFAASFQWALVPSHLAGAPEFAVHVSAEGTGNCRYADEVMA